VADVAGRSADIVPAGAAGSGGILLRIVSRLSEQHYRIEVTPGGVVLAGGGEAGLYYAAQTFRQLAAQARGGVLPALRIDDGPDYPVRGFYHDISRGKVPTRETLLALVEKLASYKINQLQLYIEHTFAFARHADVWAGADPLTAEDIRAIDEHAARHHVELVPSLSTFGHFYTALVSPRKSHLNELPLDAARLPFSWWDRMGHYTLDCRNPESLALVREMIRELRPLFRSKRFNLCCDETFDLGLGRNADEAARVGTGRLYVDFLTQLIAVVREAGCTPMFWGDIVGNHPELVGELPADVIALDWDYSRELKDTKARRFRRAGVPFYVCPGVCGWDRWVNDLDTATANITAFAARGRREGAIGLLNTDWGDRGHINCLGNSLHGMILGAAAAWNGRATGATPAKVGAFDAAFARLELGDATGRAGGLMREAGRLNVVSWRLFTLWLDPTPHRPAAWWDERTGVPADMLAIDPREAFAAARRLDAIRARLGHLLRFTLQGPATSLSGAARGSAPTSRGWKEPDGVDAGSLPAEASREGRALGRVAGRTGDTCAAPAGPARHGPCAQWSDALAARELLLGCRGSALMNALGGWVICLARGVPAPRGARPTLELTNDLRCFEGEFSAVWHARNRPSEYWRLRAALLEIARRIDLAALRGVWVKRAIAGAPET
jgi:hypothetical protein